MWLSQGEAGGRAGGAGGGCTLEREGCRCHAGFSHSLRVAGWVVRMSRWISPAFAPPGAQAEQLRPEAHTQPLTLSHTSRVPQPTSASRGVHTAGACHLWRQFQDSPQVWALRRRQAGGQGSSSRVPRKHARTPKVRVPIVRHTQATASVPEVWGTRTQDPS